MERSNCIEDSSSRVVNSTNTKTSLPPPSPPGEHCIDIKKTTSKLEQGLQ